MKKHLLFLSVIMLISISLSAQETLVAYQFNVTNSYAPTAANVYNTGDQLLREATYSASYTFPSGISSYSLTTDGWVNAMNFEGGYYTVISTIAKKNLKVSSYQKSSVTGPGDFKIQYRIGLTGLWTDVITDTIKCSSNNFILGRVVNAPLPVICENQPEVYLRWIVVSDKNATGGVIDSNGTNSIDNVSVTSVYNEAFGYLDINKIKANIHTGGVNLFGEEMGFPGFEYPKDSGKYSIFCSSLWLGGKNQGDLYLAGERYHGNGRDYYPGPIMDSNNAFTEMYNWNQVWKINKSEIDYHMAHWNDAGYVVPQSISQWPVYSNPALGLNYYLAPFVDVDGDSAYIPANGDYPKIRGDQAIYFIINDSVYQHTETGGKKLGVEVHAMAYAFDSDPLLAKTVFMNYMVYNRSNRVYDSLYMGLFTDTDIGYAQDDYVGCDTTLETYYGYNVDSIDGSGQPTAYGSNPPVQTVTLLNQHMSSFFYCNNTGGLEAITDPSAASEYYSYMTGHWKDGSHLCYGGLGHPLAGGDSTHPVHYMFPGNPNDSTQWNERQAGNPPYDRRGIGVSGPFTFAPGQFISFDVAYITVDSGSAKGGGFPNIDNMLSIVPLIRDYFDSNFPQDGHDVALGVDKEDAGSVDFQCNVFPNPANDRITFTTNLSNSKLRLDILDINGRLIQSYDCNGSKKEMDVSGFKKGVYILKISSAQQNSFVKFIKM
ncbi:MAG: T9SS type A sorting domain-containing protein [Bacteroidota bacterium]